jgi:cobalamin synthase
MNAENGVLYLTVAFVLAEGVNVWACWNNPPYSGIGDVDYETLRKGEKASALFVTGYGLFATILSRNLFPLIVALLFNALMFWIYEREYNEDKEKKRGFNF